LHFVELIPTLLKLLEVCQETQTDTKKLNQKVDSLENLVKKQVENQNINSEKSFKGSGNYKNDNNWIEV
jgi:hypothetical protein